MTDLHSVSSPNLPRLRWAALAVVMVGLCGCEKPVADPAYVSALEAWTKKSCECYARPTDHPDQSRALDAECSKIKEPAMPANTPNDEPDHPNWKAQARFTEAAMQCRTDTMVPRLQRP